MAMMGAHRVADELRVGPKRSGSRRTVVDETTGW
jgi:hypothetical protein